MRIALFTSWITGMMVGVEFVEDWVSEDEVIKHIVLDFFIVRVNLAWGAVEAFENAGEEE